MSVTIRAAEISDADAIAELICATASRSFLPDFPSYGQTRFLADRASEAMRRRLESGDFQYYVAELGGSIIGVVGIREGSHLFNLFVAEHAQGHGLGKLLWEHAKGRCLAGRPVEAFTVNSAKSAVGVYEGLGFVIVGDVVGSGGVVYIPMRLTIAPNNRWSGP